MSLTESFIKELILKKEGDKLDFKQTWYDEHNKGELVKDIISLANGSIHSIGQDGYLLVGINEVTKDTINVQVTDKSGKIKSESKLHDELTQLVKNHTNKPLKLDLKYFKVNENNLIIVKVYANNYIVYLEKELQGKGKRFSKGYLIYRVDSLVEEATEEVRQEFECKIKAISNNSLDEKDDDYLRDDIKIEASDILELLVSPRDRVMLSENQGVNRDKIHYEYYCLGKKQKEVYIFLGEPSEQSRNIRAFEDFSGKIKEDNPSIVEFFIVKRYKDGKAINGKIDVYTKINDFSLKNGRVSEVNVHYLDEFIWENTIPKSKNSEVYKKDEFVDQEVYKTDGGSSLGKSIDFFEKEVLNSTGKPISIVYGLGGVGKTTFCDTLNYKIAKNREDNDKEDSKGNYVEFKNKKIFYLKSDRLIKFYLNKNSEIKSLYDLYSIYKDDPSVKEFSETSLDYFKLNFLSGNIIVAIDAIEEIDSALDSRFHINEFFSSLASLYERLKSIKIIITTRGGYFLDKIRDLSIVKNGLVEFYGLNGFEEKDIDDFLKKKYRGSPGKIRDAKQFIESYNLSSNGHIIPLLLDLVCEITDRPDKGSNAESIYFIKEEPIDKILMILLGREIENQSLNIDIDGFFGVFEEITIGGNGFLNKKEFEDIIKGITDQNHSNYIKNPLFVETEINVVLRFDFLNNLIKARYASYSIISGKFSPDRLVKVLKDCYLGQGEIYAEISKVLILKNENIILKLSKTLQGLLPLLSAYEENKLMRENVQKSISAILHIANKVVMPQTKESRTSLIRDIYDSSGLNYIKNVFIYGDFYPIDFTLFTWMDSSFVRYAGFAKSKFPEDDTVVFIATKFSDINILESTVLRKSFFDGTCQINNCNFDEVFVSLGSKKNQKIDLVRKDVVSIFSYMESYSRSYNKINQHCKVSYSKGLKKFLDLLCRYDVLDFIKENGDELYKVNRRFFSSISSIKISVFPDELESVLTEIAD
ncbi:ATP-binding protein [Thiothrix subterranea]|uniref:ATP-binding protein n=1 Tax=Thiothrix subterranea TaxID=2735563 RepID=UPI00192AA479|nr:ATP-binding protein [Thiothrix subterranea]QQZ27530.1 ATP-binding protein [Thiothrix subterranea]